MNELLKMVFSLSLCASLFILPLLLCRPLLKKFFSRRWQYYIWLIVILRLLIPFAPPVSPVGELFRQPSVRTDFQEEPGFLSGDKAGSEAPAFLLPDTAPALDSSPVQEPEPPAGASLPLQKLGGILRENLWLVWLGTALILLVRKITVYQSFKRYMKAGCREISELSLLERLAQLEEQLKIKRPLELYENPMASSPLLLGFFRPCIVLPSAGLPEGDFRYTVLHELIHCRRRDMLYKWLVQLCICLHWFNPLVWRMGREINRACELSCDEALIRLLDGQERRAYGDTLMRALETGGPAKNALASVTLSENAQLIKERLDAIMKFKKRSFLAGAFSLLLAAALAVGAAAAGAYTGPVRQGGNLPAAADEAAEEFRYTQEGYYQPPYLFEIGWNLQEKMAEGYTSRLFTVWDEEKQKNETLTACFTPECAQLKNDTAAMQALSAQLSRLYLETRETSFPATRFLIVSIQNVGDTDSGLLAERCYEGESLSQFGAIFAQLEETAQEEWLNRIYEDGNIAFFAASLSRLKAGNPLIKRLAEKAYAQGNISFFSVLSGHMARQQLEGWLDRARQEGKTNFRAMLLELLDKEQELTGWKAQLQTQLAREYAAHGIVKDGSGYAYQNQPVRIFLDMRENSSFQTLEINPQGTVDIKLIRGEDGGILRVEYMTKQQAQELLTDGDWENGDEWEPDGEEDFARPARAEGDAVPLIDTLSFKGKTYYLIENEAQLRALASGAYGLDKDYMQQADIQLSTKEWTPIGTRAQPFTGSFNGNGFEIRFLTMTAPQAELIGLFGAARDAHIYNVTLRDYDIESAGREAGSRTLAPVMALNLGGARCEDNLVYPRQDRADIQEKGSSGGNTLTIPVDAARIESGETLWLGEYLLFEGERISYDVSAETGGCLQIAFAAPEEDPQNRLYMSVKNRRQDGQLRCTSDFTLSSPVPPGRYRLLLRAPEGELTGVKGSIRLTAKEKKEDFGGEGVVRLSEEERPKPLQQAMENCAVRTWYVLRCGGRQYIWYNGFAWEFAYHPTRQGDGWQVDILRTKKKEAGYLLLSLPAGQQLLSLTLDGEPVSYTLLETEEG